jgi:hypothetical protein
VAISEAEPTDCWVGRSAVVIPAGAKNLFLIKIAKTFSLAHPASYSMDTAGIYSGDKAAGVVKLTIHIY